MASLGTGRTHHKFGSNERIFDPEVQKIDDFLLINKPSVLSISDGIKWIRVLGPEYYKTHGSQTCDVDELTASFQRLTHNQQGGNFEETGLAQHEINSLDQELTSGKWMLFPESDKVDDIWSKIAKATVTGKLGNGATMAKVSTVGDNESEAYIAVYTPDYRNKSQVFDVEKKMRQIGIKGKLKYKPDINTKSGVYRNNDQKVKPSIYETYDETSSSRGGYNRGRGEYGRGRGGYRGGRGGYRAERGDYRGGRGYHRGGGGEYHGGREGYRGGSRR